MSRPNFLRTFLSIAGTLAICATSYSQATQAPQKAPPRKAEATLPVKKKELEGTNNWATWTFLGKQGNGQWPSGEVANLTVESLDGDSVVIHRADSTGSSAGLTAVYKGARHGERIGGEFTSSFPGHWEDKAGNWYATIEKNSVSLPQVMHWCIGCTNGMGGTLKWENGHYLNYNDVPGQTTILTVESFTRDSVVMRRTNSGRYPGTAVLTGKISAQGNTIDGIQTDPDGRTKTFRAAWGAAIDTLPGTRGSDPVVVVRPVVCYPWFFTVVCQ